MLTTDNTKVKERSQKNVKLNMVTTGETKPKGFAVKGKPAPPPDVIVTTGNMAILQAKRKKELVKEKASARIRQKKYDAEVKETQERQRLEAKEKEGSIEEQIEALDRKKKELEGKLGKK